MKIHSISLVICMLMYSQGDYTLILDRFKYIPKENVLIVNVTASNGTNKKLHMAKCEPHNNCFIDNKFWNLVLLKDDSHYYIPLTLVDKRNITVVKIKNQSEYSFQIQVCLSSLSTDGYFTDHVAVAGKYEIQLVANFIKPNVKVKSNVISIVID